MVKQRKILGIFHIIIPCYFFACTFYMIITGSMPYMLLLSISSTIARFVPATANFILPIPIVFAILSLFGISSGIILLGSNKDPGKFSIILSFVYLLFPPIGAILGIFTIYTLSDTGRRVFGSVIAQFAIAALAFWYFHWMYPSLDNYIRQNPKTNKGIATQLDSRYVVPLYSTPANQLSIRSDSMEAHATMGMARARQGNPGGAVREFQQAADVIRKGAATKKANTWLLLPLLVMLIYYVILKAIKNSGNAIPISVLIFALTVLKIGIDVSVALINGGFATLGAPISNYLEYYSDVPKVQGIWSFLRDFDELDLSLHSETHPPGGALFLWAVARIFNYDLLTAAFAIIIFTTLILIPIYLMAKEFYGETTGRYALMLFLITPNMVIFTATCMDAVFAVFLVWSIYLYFRALSKKSAINSIIAGVAITASMIMNFTTTTLGIYFVILTILTYFRERAQLDDTVKQNYKDHLKVMFIAGGVVILLYLLLYLGPRYSVFTNLRNATGRDRGMMGTGYETLERYIFICIANLFAFFIFVGFPTTTLWIREVLKTIQNAYKKIQFDSFLISYILMFAVISLSTLFTLEVERVWLYMLPFIVIPAGKHLGEYIEKAQSSRLLYLTTALLWIQTIGFEVFMDTRW